MTAVNEDDFVFSGFELFLINGNRYAALHDLDEFDMIVPMRFYQMAGIMEQSSNNQLQMNTVRKGSGNIRPRYGVNIADTSSSHNFVANNDLLGGGETAAFFDAGTGTITISGNRI